jgi:uncharacterized damage-inducible protein DinB
MTNMDFSNVINGVSKGLDFWEAILQELPDDTISDRRNEQNRTIRQILGHMADSASNNTHRIVHLQYQESPFSFPNYAADGNNDRWIAIQNYQNENWEYLIQYWKYTHLHLMHVIQNVNPGKLENSWISASKYGNITLKDMIIDFLRHFNLHLGEIEELINKKI